MAEIFNFFFLTFENKLKNELEKFLLQKNSRKTKWPEGSMYWHIFEKIAKKLNMKSGADKRRFLDCSKIVQKLCFVLGLVTLISFFFAIFSKMHQSMSTLVSESEVSFWTNQENLENNAYVRFDQKKFELHKFS